MLLFDYLIVSRTLCLTMTRGTLIDLRIPVIGTLTLVVDTFTDTMPEL
jgi:hypothetical protein